MTFTYDGLPTAPSAMGSYTVVGTINDTYYAGSATGTLEITSAATDYDNWAESYLPAIVTDPAADWTATA